MSFARFYPILPMFDVFLAATHGFSNKCPSFFVFWEVTTQDMELNHSQEEHAAQILLRNLICRIFYLPKDGYTSNGFCWNGDCVAICK